MTTLLTVAVVTFERPAELRRLLGSLARMDVPAEDVAVEVLVVDNDPTGSARAVVDALDAFPFPVRTAIERRPGVAHVRNTALREAHSSQLVAFVDDDAVVSPGWVRALVATQRRTGAAAVAGRVVNRFEGRAELRAAGFYATRSLPTGTTVRVAGAGNLLLTRRALERLGPDPFDPEFGLTGGEDSDFTRRLTALGERIAWCQEALVEEVVPDARLTRRWAVFRTFRVGATDGRLHRRGRGGPVGWVTCVAGGLARITAASALLLLGLATRDRVRRLRALRLGARGAGFLVAAGGRQPREYARAPVRSPRATR